ncbi:helix-turn-helix domain-containing protein [Streptomyces phaeochromogenes]|uniref:helix-turn-helix domain-containing protein n=1 Tax=Streptomyces phaeochromogenes TaxID=1923 RepID=UPI003687691F|nr:helix-turn-helix domain-containing protein [Streptomyces phaeochromogenes]MCX4564375.1 helix-turn-helix domain-containing protein [Streptomyces phaeochromogenes]
MARERSGRTVAHLVLATRLKTLREAAGMSRGEAANALGAHTATVRRIEQAETSLDEGQVHALLTAYGAGAAEIEAFLGELAAANLPGWWHPWRSVMDPWQLDLMSVESAARIIRVWEPALVPALLRTPSYARAVDNVRRPDLSPADKDRRSELLMERQKRLRQQNTSIWAIMSAAALHTFVGNEDVMAEQRQALRAALARPDVTLQIHPLGGRCHPMTGMPTVSLYRVDVPEIPDHVVREGDLDGSADVLNSLHAVSAYHLLMDHTCVIAPHPNESKDVLT